MNKTVLIGVICLAIGLVIGFFGANSLNREYAVNQPGSGSNTIMPAQPITTAQPSTSGPLPDIAEMLEKAEKEKDNFAVQMQTGDMYAQIQRFEEAIKYYKRGLELQPDEPRANLVIATAYFDTRNWELASQHLERVLLSNPGDHNARTDLGTTFLERDPPQFDRAIQEFNTVLAEAPNHEPALYYLGLTYFRSGNKEKADETLQRLEKANPASALIGRLRQNMAVN